MYVSLAQIALLLAAAAVAAPLGRWLGLGKVLGYLLAGIIIGPFGIGRMFSLYEAKSILHIAEFGVVLLLFLIGLELKPKRLWAMRSSIFGAGALQVAATAVLLCIIGLMLGAAPPLALFVGLALALSSTAFALQVLEERGELTARHGRLGFSILLFQDLAAIPLIALVPVFAVSATVQGGMDVIGAARAILVILAIVIIGHYVLENVFRLIARTKVREAMTAAALLTVVGVAWVMQLAGLSAALGAFLAGALLAESSYRHQLEADLQPFEGLLLGLFFTAVGMSLDLTVLQTAPGMVAAFVLGLVAIKALVLYAVGRWQGLEPIAARRLALVVSQGGEFAFVLFNAGVGAGVLGQDISDQLTVVVTLSMAITPLLLVIDDQVRRLGRAPVQPAFDALPEKDGHVVIAGLGRFGQIVARVLRAKKIPIIALDLDPEQIVLLRRFGSEAYFGDASRPDILEAARVAQARAFVLAIDDVDDSLATASLVRARYPAVPVFARARNRNHAHRLMDLEVTSIRRETFASALELTRDLLRGLGLTERDARFAVETFAAHDRRRLNDDYKHYTDTEKMQAVARSDAEALARLLGEDEAEAVKPKEPAKTKAPGRSKETAR